MVEYLVAVGMFLAGYILVTWTFSRASRQKWVVIPGVADAPSEGPQVIARSDADEAVLEALRADKNVRSTDGIGRF